MARFKATASLRIALVVTLSASVLVANAATAARSGCDSRVKVPGGDWPTQGGSLAQTNYQLAEKKISRITVANLKLKWVTSAPVNAGQGTPVVAGDCAFVTGGGFVYAVDTATGKMVWRTGPAALPYGGSAFVAYPPSGLSVVNGRVHLGLDNRNKPVGMAFDARTGTQLWKSKPILFGYRALQLSAPKVFDGMQLLFTTGPDFNGHARPGFALLDERTGRVIKQRTTLTPAMLKEGYSGGGVWATAAIDPVAKYAYVGTSNPYSKTKESVYDNAIIRIDLDRRRATFGQVVQAYKGVPDVVTPALYNNPACQTLAPNVPDGTNFGELSCLQQDADFGSGPMLFRNKAGRLLLAEQQKDGTLHILDAATMAKQHAILIGANSNLTATSGDMGMPMWDGTNIIVASNPGTLYAINPDTSSIVWATPLQENFMTTRPVVGANGVAFTLAANESYLIAHDTSTGLPIKVIDLQQETGQRCSGGAYGGMAIAGHKLFINCGNFLAALGIS